MRTLLIIASLMAATPAAAQKIIQIVPMPTPTVTPVPPKPQQQQQLSEQERQQQHDDLLRKYTREEPTNEMNAYAGRLERAILEAGMSVSVHAMGGGYYNRMGTPLPYLWFYGPYFSKATVFQFVKDGILLQTAKKLGFRAVAFGSKISTDTFAFDLSGSDIPRCTSSRFSIGEGMGLCW